MIGRIDPAQREVTVVGAGVAGLLAGHAIHALEEREFKITVIEQADRTGGLIETRAITDSNGKWIGITETAAHSLLATPAVEKLCAELGVTLFDVNPKSRARYIFRDGKMRRFPLRPLEALGAFFHAAFFPALSRHRGESVTLEEWGTYFLGKAATRYLLTPFTRGIYGAEPSDLCVAAAFPRLRVPVGFSLLGFILPSLILKRIFTRTPRARMAAPAGGMGELVRALEKSLRANTRVTFKCSQALERLPEGGNVVLCVPAAAAARLMAAVDPKTASAIQNIEYSALISVTALVRSEYISPTPCGVGVLLAPGEQANCLGILFNSSAFEGRAAPGWISLTLMYGGSTDPRAVDATDAGIRRRVAADLALVLGFRGGPGADDLKIAIHRVERAIPRYDARLAHALESAARGFCLKPGRVLFGNYTGEVSLRGMVERAAALAELSPRAFPGDAGHRLRDSGAAPPAARASG